MDRRLNSITTSNLDGLSLIAGSIAFISFVVAITNRSSFSINPSEQGILPVSRLYYLSLFNN